MLKKLFTIFTFLVLLVLLKSQTSHSTNIVYTKHYLGKFTITSYNAVREQCDDDWWIGAHGIVATKSGKPLGKFFASNFMRSGTQIVLPNVTGNIIWTCRDRLHPRYAHRIDLLLPIGQQIDKQRTKVYIVKERKL